MVFLQKIIFLQILLELITEVFRISDALVELAGLGW